ncbi:MAG: hypothetical protein WCJ29_04095 [bacterium]
MKWNKLLAILGLLVSLFVPQIPVFAAIDTGIDATAGKAGFETTETNIPILVSKVVYVFITLLGILLMVLFLYGGYEWMTSMGEEKKVKHAKDTVMNATIGLFIVLASYVISSYTFKQLGEIIK